MKFRKKVVVEAHQWFKNGDHPDDALPPKKENAGPFTQEGMIVRYYRVPHLDGQTRCPHCNEIMHLHGWIDTIEGGHTVCPGDWIITSTEGKRHPCKPDIFEATYEPITEKEEK